MVKTISCIFFTLCLLNSTAQDSALSESISRGSEVYNDFCITCHLGSGAGMKGVIPPLAKSDFLLKRRKESIHVIKYGQQGEIVVNGVKYNGTMANLKLTDEEVADVMNYILNSWGNKEKNMVTPEEVRAVRP